MNKKWLMITTSILLVLIFGAGCTNKDTGGASPSPSSTAPTASANTAEPSAEASSSPTPSADTQKPVMDTFQTLLKMPGNEKAAITFLQQNISQLSPKNADEMMLAFEAYQKDAINQAAIVSDTLVKLIQTSGGPYNEKILNDLSKITNPDLKVLLQGVFEKGYKIIVPEGNYEAVIDYGVYKDYEKYVSPDIAAYIEIMAKESESRMSEDAAIIIPIDEVFVRALASESFITTYPNSVKYDQINQKYANYVDACFFGQNNTPAFDYITKKLNQEFLSSYEKVAQSGKNSPLIKEVVEYLKVLKDNDNTLTTAITNYRKSITNSLKNTAS